LSKRRMTAKAKADVEESIDAIAEYKKDVEELQEDQEKAIQEIQEKWLDIVEDIDEIPVTPYKKDVMLDLFGIAWMPNHLVEVDGELVEYPGYKED